MTFGVTLIPFFSETAAHAILEHTIVLMVIAVSSMVFMCCLLCIKPLGRTVPCNYLILILFTLCEAYIVAFVCSAVNEPKIVVASAFFTAVIVFSLTLYALLTK